MILPSPAKISASSGFWVSRAPASSLQGQSLLEAGGTPTSQEPPACRVPALGQDWEVTTYSKNVSQSDTSLCLILRLFIHELKAVEAVYAVAPNPTEGL